MLLHLLLLAVPLESSYEYTCSDTMLNAKTQFGAVGDGVTDDSEHLQKAIDAAVGCGGKALFLPVGTYMLSRALRVSGHMMMLGEGASGSCHGLDANVSAANMRGTVLLQTNSSADGIYVSVGSHCESVQLRDFSLVARPVHSTGAAVRVVGIENNMCDGKIERLLIENWETGVHCLACQNAALNDLKIRRPWGRGVIIEGSVSLHFRLSHSFLHTNLKIPCAEQGLPRLQQLLQRLGAAAWRRLPPSEGHAVR